MAPVSGKVVEVNADVVANVGLVNTKAESDGTSCYTWLFAMLTTCSAWLVKVEVGANIKSELSALMDGAKYDAFCKSAH
jgi:glycine cleavage system H lipoate-binding protein